MKAPILSKRNIRAGCGGPVLCLLSALALAACGSGSSSSDPVPSVLGQTLTGSIKSITGIQSEMNQWVLALFERDSGISHVGMVNQVGNFSIPGVDLNLAYSFVLLDPQFKIAAVLSAAGDTNKVRQYFRTSQTQLPALAQNGPIVSFTDLTAISWEGQQASDSDGDLIPDGRDELAFRLAAADTDGDGIDNSTDSDIDGDGIANWFDSDDDGDGIVDAFDADANGDGVIDLNQAVGDLYFSSFVQYVFAQVTQDVQEDESFSTSLTITAKLQETSKPSAMKARLPKALTDGATAVVFNEQKGETNENSWDGSLADDGLNEDGGKDDKTFARRIKLAKGVVPKAHQVIFIQYVTGEDANLRIREFPYTFPDLVTGVIKGSYASDTRTVTLAGSPFEGITDFHWSVHIYDAASYKVFASAPVAGTESTYTIPNGVLETGKTYTARIVASALERIPSFPSWVIRSASFGL